MAYGLGEHNPKNEKDLQNVLAGMGKAALMPFDLLVAAGNVGVNELNRAAGVPDDIVNANIAAAEEARMVPSNWLQENVGDYDSGAGLVGQMTSIGGPALSATKSAARAVTKKPMATYLGNRLTGYDTMSPADLQKIANDRADMQRIINGDMAGRINEASRVKQAPVMDAMRQQARALQQMKDDQINYASSLNRLGNDYDPGYIDKAIKSDNYTSYYGKPVSYDENNDLFYYMINENIEPTPKGLPVGVNPRSNSKSLGNQAKVTEFLNDIDEWGHLRAQDPAGFDMAVNARRPNETMGDALERYAIDKYNDELEQY